MTVRRFRAPTYRANHVSPSTGHGVITVSHPDEFTNHYGGQLAFGRTGLLFMSTGDGGGGGDPSDHAQDRSTLQGKLLRLKVLGARAACGDFYCVPRSNPYAGKTPGRGEIWATGLRNAWRFSVDPATGDLWVGDVGQGAFEEVDRIPAGAGGRNLGWSCREGFETFDESRCRPGARYLDPVIAYGRDYGTTITGGFVYRGSRYAALLGGQLRRRRLRVGPGVPPRGHHPARRGHATRRRDELRRGRRTRAVGRDHLRAAAADACLMTTLARVAEVWVFPVKSMSGTKVDAAEAGAVGLAGDRSWAVVDADGNTVTAKDEPRLREVVPRLVDGDLRLDVPGAVTGLDPETAGAALSSWLGRQVRLAHRDGAGFVDVAPLHVVSTTSMTDADPRRGLRQLRHHGAAGEPRPGPRRPRPGRSATGWAGR